METVILIGVQGAGKTWFYHETFSRSHLRISLDMVRTRNREKRLVEVCLEVKQRFVVDNTNPTPDDRLRYIVPARAAHFRVIGYYFQAVAAALLERNRHRPEAERVPEAGILATYRKLVQPHYEEGFDELYYVAPAPPNGFAVSRWQDEV